MNILKKILMGIVVILVLLAIVGFMLPRQYKVERSITVQAPAEVVFDQVNDFKKNEAWSPWKAQDPTVTITYGPVSEGKGAVSSWTSQKSGNGTQTIVESVPNQSIKTFLDFGNMGTANGDWQFAAEGEGVKVTQSMSGDEGMNPFKRYMGLMVDKFIGPVFEKGLASLKQVSETRAAEIKAQQATQQAAAPAVGAPGAAAAPASGAPGSAAPAAPSTKTPATPATKTR